MKKIILLTTFFFSLNAVSQKATVEKNLYGFQLGLLSASFQYETKLARKTALHIETGAALYTYKINSYDSTGKSKLGTITAPFFAVEPRFYYGLDRRARLNKNTSHNGSNFISLNMLYIANDKEFTNSSSYYKIVPSFNVIPTYGIRRSFAKNFNYEFSFGVGLQNNIVPTNETCTCKKTETAYDLQARLGYNF